MAVLFHYFLLQTDFEKDVDIACRSGKNIERIFSQQIVLYKILVKWKPEKYWGLAVSRKYLLI